MGFLGEHHLPLLVDGRLDGLQRAIRALQHQLHARHLVVLADLLLKARPQLDLAVPRLRPQGLLLLLVTPLGPIIDDEKVRVPAIEARLVAAVLATLAVGDSERLERLLYPLLVAQVLALVLLCVLRQRPPKGRCGGDLP